MGLSSLGIFHTVIGLAAIAGALAGLTRYGRINLSVLSGRVYFYATIITSVSALGISKQGGFNAGHAFSVFIIVLVAVSYFLHTRKATNIRARYLETLLLSFSFFLSLVPTVNETFTRVPVGHPLASSITDPLIGRTLLGLFIVFVAGSVYQVYKLKKANN